MKDRRENRSTFMLRRTISKRSSGCDLKSNSLIMMASMLAFCASCWKSSRVTETGSREPGMDISPSPTRVHFDQDSMWVDLSDGRIIGVPLAWFPRLLRGNEERGMRVGISSRGMHWEALDE